MTQRPLLEKASWLAGIASAIIAAIVWLKPDTTANAVTEKPNNQHVPAPTERAISKPSSQPIGQETTTRWSCENVAVDLQPAFIAAKNINYTGPRDQAFLSLARKALCIENYAMFEEAAKQIAYTAPRDQAYGDAVDFVLGLRKFELAEQYAKQIAYTAPQDAARARIVAKSSER